MSSHQEFTEAWLPGPSSTQFYTRTYSPQPSTTTKAIIVFLHGFAEHIARYAHFHPLLAARGIAVFAFDQRGFGLTAMHEEKKSRTSAYGKTGWKEQMADIKWAIEHVRETFEDLPVFLMGHSMGGGEVLGFATQGEQSPSYSIVTSLAGIIATSPLITQTTPVSKVTRFFGGKASLLFPYMLIPADVNPDYLSRDKEVGAAYMSDPLVKQSGSLKGLNDMLSQGDALLHTRYQYWPQGLPVLIVHGTDDKVTSHKSSQSFFDILNTSKKSILLYPGGYHELQNEPDGVKEKLAEDVIAFVNERVPDTPIVTVTPPSAVATQRAKM